MSRSPIFSHFQESILGTTSIRAYRQGLRFSQRSDELVDINNAAHLVLLTSNRFCVELFFRLKVLIRSCLFSWLGIYLDIIGVFLIGFASFFAVANRSTLSPGQVGLSVTYALAVNFKLCFVFIFANYVTDDTFTDGGFTSLGNIRNWCIRN